MIIGRLDGDASTLLRLSSMGVRIRTALRTAVTRGEIQLTRCVKQSKLSGQVLKNRTGTLRRKINGVVLETPSSITGRVGVKLSYAAAHEYGIDKVVTVREHLRTVKQAFGRPIAPVQSVVGSHTRHMHLPERSFLRSALRDMAPGLREQLKVAVVGATK